MPSVPDCVIGHGRRRASFRRSFLAALLSTLAAASVLADHPLPGPHFLRCESEGVLVRLCWDELGIGEDGLFTAVLLRDGEHLADLHPQALCHEDPCADPAPHVYRLDILRTGAVDDEVVASRECRIDTSAGSAVDCQVFGGIATPPSVCIRWTDVSQCFPVIGYTVLRDGEVAATLEPRASEYKEEPLRGEVRYTVLAMLAAAGPAGGGLGESVEIGSCTAVFDPPRIGGFRRGDANADGTRDISDPIAVVSYLFLGGEAPGCLQALDADDNGRLEITDAIFLARHLFLGGRPPPAPFAECDFDTTEDGLGCETFAPCFHPPPP